MPIPGRTIRSCCCGVPKEVSTNDRNRFSNPVIGYQTERGTDQRHATRETVILEKLKTQGQRKASIIRMIENVRCNFGINKL